MHCSSSKLESTVARKYAAKTPPECHVVVNTIKIELAADVTYETSGMKVNATEDGLEV